ncbi:MAG: hypothetical protein J6K39_03870 [Clostridia bacterium]|nr:hypothetical protein [Clostridia bacterium]
MKKEENKFMVYAVPKKSAYIVSQEEFERIKNSKPDKKILSKCEKLSAKLNVVDKTKEGDDGRSK